MLNAFDRVIAFANSWITVAQLIKKGFNDLETRSAEAEITVATAATNRLATVMWALDREYAVGNGLALSDGTPLVDDEKSREARLALRTSVLGGHVAVGFAAEAVEAATQPKDIPVTLGARQKQIEQMWKAFNAATKSTENTAAASALLGEQWQKFSDDMNNGTRSKADALNQYKTASSLQSIIASKPEVKDFVAAVGAAFGGVDDVKGGGGGGGAGGGFRGQGETALIQAFSDLQRRNAQLACAVAFLNRRVSVANITITGLAAVVTGNDKRARSISKYIEAFSVSHADDALQAANYELVTEMKARSELLSIVAVASMSKRNEDIAEIITEAIVDHFKQGGQRDLDLTMQKSAWNGSRGRDYTHFRGFASRIIELVTNEHKAENMEAEDEKDDEQGDASTTDAVLRRICAVQHARARARLLVFPVRGLSDALYASTHALANDNRNPLEHADFEFTKALRAVCLGRGANFSDTEIRDLGNAALGWCIQRIPSPTMADRNTSGEFAELYETPAREPVPHILEQPADRTAYIATFGAVMKILDGLHVQLIDRYKELLQKELHETPRTRITLELMSHAFGEARMIDRVFRYGEEGQAPLVALWNDYFQEASIETHTTRQVFRIIANASGANAEQARIFGDAELKWGIAAMEKKTATELKVENDMRVRDLEIERTSVAVRTFKALAGVCVARAHQHRKVLEKVGQRLLAARARLEDIEPGPLELPADDEDRREALESRQLGKFPFPNQLAEAVRDVTVPGAGNRFFAGATGRQVDAVRDFDIQVNDLATAMRVTHIKNVVASSAHLLARLWANTNRTETQFSNMGSMLEVVTSTLQSFPENDVPEKSLHLERTFARAMEQRNLGELFDEIQEGLAERARRDRITEGKDMKWEEMLARTLQTAAIAHAAFSLTDKHSDAMQQAMLYPSDIQGYTEASEQMRALVARKDDARVKTMEVARVSGSMRVYLAWAFKEMLEYLSLTVADRTLQMPARPVFAGHSLVKRIDDLNRAFTEKIEKGMQEVRDYARKVAEDAAAARKTIEGSLPTVVELAEQIAQLKRHRSNALAYVAFQGQLVEAFVPQIGPAAAAAAGAPAHGALVELLYLHPRYELHVDWRPLADDNFVHLHGVQVGTVLLYIFRCIDRAAEAYMECIDFYTARIPQSAAIDRLRQELDAFTNAVVRPNGFVTQTNALGRWVNVHTQPNCAFEAGVRILKGDGNFSDNTSFANVYTVGNAVANGLVTRGLVDGTNPLGVGGDAVFLRDDALGALTAQTAQLMRARESLLEVIPKALRVASDFIDLVNRTRNMENGIFVAGPANVNGRLYREAWGVSRLRMHNETLATTADSRDYDDKRVTVLRSFAALSFFPVRPTIDMGMPIRAQMGNDSLVPTGNSVFFPIDNPQGAANWVFPWHVVQDADDEGKRDAWRNARQMMFRGWDLVSRLRSVTAAIPVLPGDVPVDYPGTRDALYQITRNAHGHNAAAAFPQLIRPPNARRIEWGARAPPDTTSALNRTINLLGAFEVGLMQEDLKVSDRTTPLKEIQRRQGRARTDVLTEYRVLETTGRAYWAAVLRQMRLDGIQFAARDASLLEQGDWDRVQRLALELKQSATVQANRAERAIEALTMRFTRIDTDTQIALNDLRNNIGRWIFAQTNGIALSIRNSLHAMIPPMRISNRWSLYGSDERGDVLPDRAFERNVLALINAADADASELLGDLEAAIQVGGVEGIKAIVKGRETEIYREAKAVLDAHSAAIGPGSVFADTVSARPELDSIRALLQTQGMGLSDPSIRGTIKDALALLQRLIVIKNAAKDAAAGYSVSGGSGATGAAAGRAGDGAQDDDTGIRDLASPQRALQGQGEYARLEVIASGDAQRDWLICRLARWLTIVQGDARIDRVAKMIQGGGLHVSNGFVYFNSSTEYAGLVRQSRGLRERLNLAMATMTRKAGNGFEAVHVDVRRRMQANQNDLLNAQQAVARLVDEIHGVNTRVATAHADMDKMLDTMMDEIRGRIRGWKYTEDAPPRAVYLRPDGTEGHAANRDQITLERGRRVPSDYSSAPPRHDPVLFDDLEGPDKEMRHFDLILYYLLSPEVYSALMGLLRLLSTCPGALKTAYDKFIADGRVRQRAAGPDQRTLTEWMVSGDVVGADPLGRPPVAKRDTSLSRLFAAILFDDQLALLSAYLMSATLQGMVLTSTGMGGDAKADAVARAKITQRYRLLQHNIETYMRTHSLISRT